MFHDFFAFLRHIENGSNHKPSKPLENAYECIHFTLDLRSIKNDDNDHGYDPFYLDAKGKKSHDLEMLKKTKR